MEQAIQIFSNPEFGSVRIIGDAENPRFCLADLCRILGIGNPSDVKNRLDKGVVSIETLETAGGMQKLTFVSEDGLYDVILDSRKPEAKRFRKWVTSEVLPNIRKHGMYIDPSKPISGDQLILIGQRMKALEAQNALLQVQNAELQPKADYCDVILQCKDLVITSIIAKDYGYSAKRFNKLLHELGVQFKQSGIWLLYQKHATKGWTQTKTHSYTGADGEMHCKAHTYWTQKGRIELYHILKRNGILPMIER